MNTSIAFQLPKLNKYDYYFIHIPKNGGTAFERYFLSRHFGHYPLHAYPQEIWSRTVAIFRNPLTRLTSIYNYSRMKKSYWHSDDGSTPYGKNKLYEYCHTHTFAQFIRDVCNGNFDDNIHLSAQYRFIVTPDNEIPTTLLRFEKLDQDLTRLLGANIVLPKFNVSTRSNNAGRFTDELKNLVYQKFEPDFRIFAYLRAHEQANKIPSGFL